MINLRDEVCRRVADRVSTYSSYELVSMSAGLLTEPSVQANAIRLETLTHIAIAYAKGSCKPNRTLINKACNELLSPSKLSFSEDPAEDVLVSNITTSEGDFLIFNGLWEGSDYYTQVVIDVLTLESLPAALQNTRDSCLVLLKMSDAVARKRGACRNVISRSLPNENINIPNTNALDSYSRSVTFTEEDLASFNIDKADLECFILSEYDQLKDQPIENSALLEKPIIELQNRLILALPTAVSLAIRYLTLRGCKSLRLSSSFNDVLNSRQFHHLKERALFSLKTKFEEIDQEISQPDECFPNDEILFSDGCGSYRHIMILHDSVEQILKSGFSDITNMEASGSQALQAHIEAVASECTSDPYFTTGTTLLVIGGLGRALTLGFDSWPENWNFASLGIHDLMLLSGNGDNRLSEFLDCIDQKNWLQDQGLQIMNINGDFNYFSFWRDNDYVCVPEDLPISKGSLFTLETDFTSSLREKLRVSSDFHVSEYVDGTFYQVERLTQNSFYQEMRKMPIYVSIDHLNSGLLKGVIESENLNLWLGFRNEETDFSSRLLYNLWSGLIELCEVGIEHICQLCKEELVDCQLIVETELSAKDVLIPRDFIPESEKNRGIDVDVNGRSFTLKMQSNFLTNFYQDENIGERLLIIRIFDCILDSLNRQGISLGLTGAGMADFLLYDNGARLIHIFQSTNDIDNLLYRAGQAPKLINRTQVPFHKLKICHINEFAGKIITTSSESRKALNKIVDDCWQEIRSILRATNKKSLLEVALFNLHDIHLDKIQWRSTAKAIQRLYAQYDEVYAVSQKRDSDRNLTSMCLRTIIEMAICESDESSGCDANQLIIERLIVLCTVLIEVASDSDAVYSRFIDPQIEFKANGMYHLSSDPYKDIVIPYLSGFFRSQFDEAVASYGELYEQDFGPLDDVESFDDERFTDALFDEIGLTPHEVVRISSSLIREHIEANCSIMTFDPEEIYRVVGRAEIHREGSGDRFLEAFCLTSRKKWENPPRGYKFNDIAPWKFKRRLSSLCKPLLSMSDGKFMSSVFLLRQGMSYFLDLAEKGLFDTEFFESKLMRSFVGDKIRERGYWFNDVVSEKFSEMGFEVEKEIEMKSIGAPKELGDIDVIAWKNGQLFLIECKNLQMAKTISEIADICNRFQGDDQDELMKHLRRVEWVESNKEHALSRLNFGDEDPEIINLLVTNTTLPVKYKNDIPIDVDNIISFEEIIDFCEKKSA